MTAGRLTELDWSIINAALARYEAELDDDGTAEMDGAEAGLTAGAYRRRLDRTREKVDARLKAARR